MTAIRLAYGALRILAHAAVDAARAPRCGRGCEFRTRDSVLMERHYYDNHAGDPASMERTTR